MPFLLPAILFPVGGVALRDVTRGLSSSYSCSKSCCNVNYKHAYSLRCLWMQQEEGISAFHFPKEAKLRKLSMQSLCF